MHAVDTNEDLAAGSVDRQGEVVIVGDIPLDGQGPLRDAFCRLGLEVLSVVPLGNRFRLLMDNEPKLFLIGMGRDPDAGIQWCHSLREWAGAPLVLVSTGRQEEELAAALEAGAADFVDYTWCSRLLLAKLQLLIGRSDDWKERSLNRIRIRDLTIDLVQHRVWLGNEDIQTTPTEFRLLSCLAQNGGAVVTASELLGKAQGYVYDDQEAQEIVKVHIHRLRQKIDRGRDKPSYIVNVRGIGYMLERRGGP